MASPAQLFSVGGKHVLITGGSRGIGQMLATGFSKAGAKVLVASRTIPDVEEVDAAAATAAALPYDSIQANLSTREGCEALAAAAGRHFPHGSVDVLIHNAGTSWGEPMERNSSARSNWGFDKVLDLNVKALFYLTRACLPLLKESVARSAAGSASTTSTGPELNQPARIITIGSVAGLVPQEAPTHAYDISKAAVHHLTRKLAAEFACHNITVNCIAPGYIPTRMSAGLSTWMTRRDGDDENDEKKSESSSSADHQDALARHIPLGRLGTADDMVGACIYLSSPAGSWCTGVILNVDGGTVGARQIPLTSSL